MRAPKTMQEEGSGGNSRTKRVSIPTSATSITLPTAIRFATFRSDGPNDIRLRINETGADFITLKAGGPWTPKIAVNGATLDAIADTAASNLECIFEG